MVRVRKLTWLRRDEHTKTASAAVPANDESHAFADGPPPLFFDSNPPADAGPSSWWRPWLAPRSVTYAYQYLGRS